MNIAIFIPFFAIFMVFGTGCFAIWTAHRQKLAKLEIEATSLLAAEKAAQYATGNSELEERVRVLERIVTDKGYDVASQIEALRDTRRVEERIEHHSAKEPN